MTTAVTQRMTVDVSHLLTRTLVRETGLEIVQARVPLSRSARRRLIVAKITAMTTNCVPTDARRLSIGWSEVTFAGASPASAGTLLISHSLILALAAVRRKTSRLTRTTVDGRLLCSHSF